MQNRIILPYKEIIGDSIRVSVPTNKSIEARTMIALFALGKYDIYKLPLDANEDIIAINNAILSFINNDTIINVKESGTAMRFMLSLLAFSTDKEITLLGEGRQNKRPISNLVDTLHQVGANIKYLDNSGYPPLIINPIKLKDVRSIEIDASLSSQYISSLLLSLPILKNEISVYAKGKIASKSYLDLSLNILKKYGIIYKVENNIFHIDRIENIEDIKLYRELDWSSISFIAQFVATHKPKAKILLQSNGLDSLQGDYYATIELFDELGVSFDYIDGYISVSYNESRDLLKKSNKNLNALPDIVPAYVCALLANDIEFDISGIEHLELKESNRINAIIDEVAKFGYKVVYSQGILSYRLEKKEKKIENISSHQDHRIAMSMSILASKFGNVVLENSSVVAKSFPFFFEEFCKLGIETRNII